MFIFDNDVTFSSNIMELRLRDFSGKDIDQDVTRAFLSCFADDTRISC